MTKTLKIMNLCKIFIQNKKFRIFINLTIFTRNFENIDLFMNSQMTISISTASHINYTQRSIQQLIFPIDFIFTDGSIIGIKKSRNMILKHRNKTKTSNQRTAIPVEIATSENAVDDCFHDAIEHTHDVMNDDINFNITKINSHLINAKEAMNKTYQDIKNPIMLKIAKQIEKLIQNFYINKNTLITTFNFDVINSKLNKIIKKMKNPEVQLSKTPNDHQHTQNQKKKNHVDTKSNLCHK